MPTTALVIKIVDFDDGRFQIPTNTFQDDSFQDYIDKYERHYLIRLLGVSLYNSFISDLDGQGVPQNPDYTYFFDSFVDETNGENCESQGIKEMLKGFIYFHYYRDTIVRLTTTGPKRDKGENSENLDKVALDYVTRYNEGVESFDCIQRFICSDSTTYPTYNGWDDVEKVLFI